MTENEQKTPRFLVVDDSGTMRRIIRVTLSKLGFNQIEEAGDGLEALNLITRNEVGLSIGIPEFDCILTDWNMPNFDGLHLLKKIRELPAYSKVPVVMITTEQSKDDVIEATRSGVSAYIVKPFTPDTLKAKISAFFKVA